MRCGFASRIIRVPTPTVNGMVRGFLLVKLKNSGNIKAIRHYCCHASFCDNTVSPVKESQDFFLTKNNVNVKSCGNLFNLPWAASFLLFVQRSRIELK
jgi:hypothetical protein